MENIHATIFSSIGCLLEYCGIITNLIIIIATFKRGSSLKSKSNILIANMSLMNFGSCIGFNIVSYY